MLHELPRTYPRITKKRGGRHKKIISASSLIWPFASDMYKSCVTLFFPANKADFSPAGEHDLLKNLPGSILAEKLSELVEIQRDKKRVNTREYVSGDAEPDQDDYM